MFVLLETLEEINFSSKSKHDINIALQKILLKYQTYIEKLLSSKYYKEFRDYSVPLKKLDAAICFCKENNLKSFNYLQESNKPFSFNIAESIEKDLIHMIKYSAPSKYLVQ